MTARKIDALIAFGLAAGYVLLLLVTAPTLGYARDEGFYFHAAESYRGWFELLLRDPGRAFERAAVDRFFGVNHEHPVFMKLAFMASHALLHDALPVFSEPGTAMRFPGMLVSALGVAVVSWWGNRAFGRAGALVAALSFAFMPRLFHHAHLACFDVPIAALLVTTAYAYARLLETPRARWVVLTGIAFGVALNTKHNSWFLPILVALHLLLVRGRHLVADVTRRGSAVRAVLVAFGVIGPLVFFAGWPWIWFDTVERLAEYVRFHREHDHYNMEFLGETYWKPPMPRAYAWVMTLGTVPFVTLSLFAVGAVSAVRGIWAARRAPSPEPDVFSTRASTDALWLLGVLVCYAPWWSSQTPIFGGTKHWFTAYPFLCLLAGRGFVAVRDVASAVLRDRLGRLASRWHAALASGLLGAAVLVGPVVMTAHAHPWGLSFYTPLVGGAPGAATLGLNRTFWGYTTGSVAECLNTRAAPGAGVYLHDTAVPSWRMLQRDGRVRADLGGTLALHRSDLALYHHEPHMGRVEYQIWVTYGTTTPFCIGTYDGVPVVWVYERPR